MSRNRRSFVRQSDIRIAVRHMHAENAKRSPFESVMFSIWFTGGAAHLPGRLHDENGSSATVYAAYDAYDYAASYVAQNPHHEVSNVSMEMALALARTAMGRAREESRTYAMNPAHKRDPYRLASIHGLGITMAVQTRRDRRSPDQAFLALASPWGTTWTAHAVFERETWHGKRRAQNLVIEVMALNLMLGAMGLPQIPMRMSGMPGRVFSAELSDFEDDMDTVRLRPTQALIAPAPTAEDLRSLPFVSLDGTLHETLPPHIDRPAFVCTSGNPPTASHMAIIDLMARSGFTPIVEITDRHPDKGELDGNELLERVNGFRGRAHTLVSPHGFFADKARAHAAARDAASAPNRPIVFAIGADVCKKLLSPYNPRREADLDAMLALGVKIHVFPRRAADGTIESFEGIGHWVDPRHRPLFVARAELPPDISSTMVRAAIGTRPKTAG